VAESGKKLIAEALIRRISAVFSTASFAITWIYPKIPIAIALGILVTNVTLVS
jgi:hypothetical protein